MSSKTAWPPTSVWLWQNVMVPAWTGIQIAVAAVVGWFQTYVAPVISATISVLGTIFTWLYNNIIKPVFTGIKLYIQVWWTVVSTIFNAVVAFITNYLAPIFQLLWAVVKVVWNGIKIAIAAVWNWIRDNVFTPIMNWIKDQIVPRFNLLKAAIATVWAAIKTAIGVAWNWIRDHVFAPIVAFVRDQIQPRFNFLKDTVRSVWTAIWTKIREVWNSIKSKAFDPLANAIKNTVPNAFEKGKDAIGRAWNKVRDVAKKPVEFVVNTIINKGIIDNFNKIADTFGTKKMPRVKLPKGFDGGGWTGPGARLQPAGVVHADEFVVKKSSRKRFERQNPGVLDHINRTGNLPIFGGYAGGGRVWQNLWRINKDEFPNSRLTSSVRNTTTVSGNASLHNAGMAIDVAGPRPGDKSAMLAIANWWRANYGAKLAELIHTPLGNKQIKNGQNYTYGGAVARQHRDHVHIAARKALDGKGGLSGSGGGAGVFDFLNPFNGLLDKITKSMPGSGEFKDLISGGAKKMVQMPIDWISEKASAIADFAGDVGTAVKDVVTAGSGRARGKAWAVAQGWPLVGGARWKALDYIVSHESSWNPKAKNPRSTASGLGQFINATSQQFLGGSPMSRFPFDDQLKAIVKYTDSRYGGLGKAMAFWKRNHYYDTGGRVTPTLYDDGGMLGPGTHLVQNATRKPEYILPADVTERLVSGGSTGVVELSATDRSLLSGLADRITVLEVDSREIARANMAGRKALRLR